MTQQDSQPMEAHKNLWKEHKTRIILGLAIILLLIVVFSPLIPEQHEVVATRTLQYSSSFGEGSTMGSSFSASYISLQVVNNDVYVGNFSITLYFWDKTTQPYQLMANSSETGFISAGETKTVYVPNSWLSNSQYSVSRDSSYNNANLINYSVVSPTIYYAATQTEWKSISTLAFGS